MKGSGPACKKRKAVASKAKLCKRRRVGPIDEAPLDGGPDAVVCAAALEGPGVPDGFDQAVIAEPERAVDEAGFVVAPGPEGPAIEPPPVVVDIVMDGLPPGPSAAPRPAGVARRGRFGPALQWDTVLCTVCGEEARQFQLAVYLGIRGGRSRIMRTKDPTTQQWAQSGQRNRTRRISVVGEDPQFARDCCQTNRICCPQAAAKPT